MLTLRSLRAPVRRSKACMTSKAAGGALLGTPGHGGTGSVGRWLGGTLGWLAGLLEGAASLAIGNGRMVLRCVQAVFMVGPCLGGLE